MNLDCATEEEKKSNCELVIELPNDYQFPTKAVWQETIKLFRHIQNFDKQYNEHQKNYDNTRIDMTVTMD